MKYETVSLTSWADIHQYDVPGWLFRGQRVASCSLHTALDRYCRRQSVPADKRAVTEERLMRDFRRSYHHYAPSVPDKDVALEWLSLMQHHGTPTRILDFTYSVYVAAYFALEYADADCAVWAIHGRWALHRSRELLEKAGKCGTERLLQQYHERDDVVFNEMFLTPPAVRCACPQTPFRLNERLRVQKGVFLVQGSLESPFEDNLAELPGHDDPANLMKLVIPFHCRPEALRKLFHMNISRTTLFPGLDGYAASLGVYSPAVVDPIPWEQSVP